MNINLDYNKAREIVYLSCRRAGAFMGFGLNAARNDQLIDFTLSREINFQIIPAQLTDGQIDEFKKSFEQWVVINGFRELMEGFSAFLDRIYEYSLIASTNGQKVKLSSVRKKISACQNKGLPGKQMLLREEFGITSELAPFLKSLYEARNCLAHNRGVVTQDFCNAGDFLEVSWRVVEIFVLKDDGTEHVIKLSKDQPPIEGPGQVQKRTVTRVRKFKVGQVISLNVTELAEICMLVFLSADSFVFPAIEYAKSKGIV